MDSAQVEPVHLSRQWSVTLHERESLHEACRDSFGALARSRLLTTPMVSSSGSSWSRWMSRIRRPARHTPSGVVWRQSADSFWLPQHARTARGPALGGRTARGPALGGQRMQGARGHRRDRARNHTRGPERPRPRVAPAAAGSRPEVAPGIGPQRGPGSGARRPRSSVRSPAACWARSRRGARRGRPDEQARAGAHVQPTLGDWFRPPPWEVGTPSPSVAASCALAVSAAEAASEKRVEMDSDRCRAAPMFRAGASRAPDPQIVVVVGGRRGVCKARASGRGGASAFVSAEVRLGQGLAGPRPIA